MKIKDTVDWDNAISRLGSRFVDIYGYSAYYSLYENYGDGEAQCFIFEKGGDCAIYPFLLNSVNECGYDLDNHYFDIQGAYGYNGVISSSSDRSFRESFYAEFNKYCDEQNIIAEFTRFNPILKNYRFAEGFMNVCFDRHTVFLDISKDKDCIWKESYSSTNRNMIRKALKNDIHIFESSNIEDYKLFYGIYVETMDNVKAEPYLYFNENYFLNLRNDLSKNHKLILASYKGEVVGGMILLIHDEYAHYHLSARKSEYGKFALNNLFLDYAIDLAKENNCKVFHFGGGTSSDEKDSLLKFKSNFSKSYSDFYIGKSVHNEKVYSEVVRQWRERNSVSYHKNNKMLLGYREV